MPLIFFFGSLARKLTEADTYRACATNLQCLMDIVSARSISMIEGLPETRDITAASGSVAWYQAATDAFKASGVGIDPTTGFRTIGGYWNLLSKNPN